MNKEINIPQTLKTALKASVTDVEHSSQPQELSLRAYWESVAKMTDNGVQPQAILAWTKDILESLSYPKDTLDYIRAEFDKEVGKHKLQLDIDELTRESVRDLIANITANYQDKIDAGEITQEELLDITISSYEEIGFKAEEPDLLIEKVFTESDLS